MTSPSVVRVRPARADDAAALSRLDVIAWSPQSGFPSVFEAGSRRGAAFFSADNPPDVHLIAEVSGTVAGYIRLKPPTSLVENAHVMHVSGLAVDPAARRRGVATALLAAAEPFAVQRGASKLSLRVLGSNRSAIALYEKLGYVTEGILRDEFRVEGAFVDDVMMAKRLEPGPLASRLEEVAEAPGE